MVQFAKKKRWISPLEIAIMALLLAVNVILSRVGSFQITPNIRISFGFLPTALMAIMFGPWKAGMVNAVWDVVNVVLFAPYMPFPGYTLSAFLGPMFYGLFMHRKEVKWYHVLPPVLINTLFVNLFLGTIWIMMLGNLPVTSWTSWVGLLPGRAILNAAMGPVRFLMILFCVTTPQLKSLIQRYSTAKR